MDLFAHADVAQQRDREIAAEVLAELLETTQQQPLPRDVARLERGVPEMKAEPLQHGVHAVLAARRQHADLHRVARIEGQADGDRFAVAQLVRR